MRRVVVWRVASCVDQFIQLVAGLSVVSSVVGVGLISLRAAVCHCFFDCFFNLGASIVEATVQKCVVKFVGYGLLVCREVRWWPCCCLFCLFGFPLAQGSSCVLCVRAWSCDSASHVECFVVGAHVYTIIGLTILYCFPHSFGDHYIVNLSGYLVGPGVCFVFVRLFLEKCVCQDEILCGSPVVKPLPSRVAWP